MRPSAAGIGRAGALLAAGQVVDGKLVCPEFLGDESAARGLARTLQVPCGSFRAPGGEKPFACLLPLHVQCLRPVYFGLALD